MIQNQMMMWLAIFLKKKRTDLKFKWNALNNYTLFQWNFKIQIIELCVFFYMFYTY